MIVDFRVRPPFGGYLNTNIYKERQRTINVACVDGVDELAEDGG